MPNRFIRLIEGGGIASVDELKSAFRALALATHPDLGGAGGRSEDFIRARAEYEAALLYLDSGGGRGEGRGGGPEGGRGAGRSGGASAFRSTAATRRAFDRAVFHADLAALLKAGFPKTPRHDKERRKYARLRVLARSALAARDPALPARFDAFERALAELRDSPEAAGRSLAAAAFRLVDELVEYEETGIVPLRAAIEIEFAALRADERTPEGLLGFLAFLVAEMDGGPALG